MATDAEKLRKVDGGVIGNFTPKNISIDANGVLVGDLTTGLKVPAGKFIVGAYIKNMKNDLTAGGSATLAVKVGSAVILTATAIASVKGGGACIVVGSPVITSAISDVKLTVATANLTAGTLEVGVIYA